MSNIEWLTIDIVSIIALVIGPLLAVVIAHRMQSRHAKHSRRMDVFRALMSTRRNRLSFEHVSAFNLVEIEFRNDPKVIEKWRKYFENLAHGNPRRESEQLLENLKEEEKRKRENLYQRRISEEREKLFTELLHEMAKTLGYEIEVFEILEGGYLPQGWGHIEDQHELIRQYVLELSSGQKALPVSILSENQDINDK